VAHDTYGNPISNTSLPVTITIQSDSLGGTIFWEELHPAVVTNDFGLITLVIGKGIKQIASTVSDFKDINWPVSPKFIKTQVFYNSQLLNMGSSRLWSVPYSMTAGDIAGPLNKLEVISNTEQMDEALFEVKNKDGKTVFAVYNEGVRIYVGDGENTKGAKGGFAIGGYDKTKSEPQDFMIVNRDSVRIYLDSETEKGVKGGFAIGSFGKTKAPEQSYLIVNSDSIRAYIDTNTEKGPKGGFAIGGFGLTKVGSEEYLRVTRDSTRVFLNDTETKGPKGGFAIGGFGTAKNTWNEYLSVTMDSVKVSKSLLIPRLTTEERDNLSFVPGEALIIFNMTEECMQIYKNDVWSNIWCFNCAPAFIIQPVDQTICSGEDAVFFVSATGTSLSYQWQESRDNEITWDIISDGGINPQYSGTNQYTLNLYNVPVSYHGYKYRCVVKGSCLPDVTSNSVTLNVGSTPPVILSQPTDQQLSTGCTADFSIASPGYSVTYKWQQSSDGGSNWTDVADGGTSPVFAGATTSDLSLSNVPWSCNNYKYRCIVSNLCGADATSNAANLTIAPSSIMIQPADQQLSTNCSANFNIMTDGGYSVSYQWQVSSDGGSSWGNITEGGTAPYYTGTVTSSLFLSNVPLAYNNYKFRCLVSSICGPNEASSAATLNLNTSPLIETQPANKLVYAGYNISFNITTSGSGFTYQWQESTNGGSTWVNVSNGGTNPGYGGANTSSLTLSNVPLAYNNYKYRCLLNHYCRPGGISDAATLSVPTPGSVMDIDGNSYNTVGIGSQLWMGENLKTTRYADGTPIALVASESAWSSLLSSDKAYCWYNDNIDNKDIYGALYNMAAMMNGSPSSNTVPSGVLGVCPTGWHLPSDAEWSDLAINLGGTLIAGGKMKETGLLLWASPNTGATNESGFTGLPGGFRSGGGAFFQLGNMALWWSTTVNTTIVDTYKGRQLLYNKAELLNVAPSFTYGASVRCVKD